MHAVGRRPRARHARAGRQTVLCPFPPFLLRASFLFPLRAGTCVTATARPSTPRSERRSGRARPTGRRGSICRSCGGSRRCTSCARPSPVVACASYRQSRFELLNVVAWKGRKSCSMAAVRCGWAAAGTSFAFLHAGARGVGSGGAEGRAAQCVQAHQVQRRELRLFP